MNTVGFAGGHKPMHKAPPKKADGQKPAPHFAGAAPAFAGKPAPAKNSPPPAHAVPHKHAKTVAQKLHLPHA